MAEFGCPATLSTPGGSIDFNDWSTGPNGMIWLIQNIDGLDGEPMRTPMDDKAGADGAWLYEFFAAARHITVSGIMVPASSLSAWQQIQQRNQMEASLRVKARTMKGYGTTGTWSWTPTGMAAYSLTVKCDVLPTFPGEGVIKQFIFGLVAGDPDYD